MNITDRDLCNDSLLGVKGWLLGLCIYLTILIPIVSLISLSLLIYIAANMSSIYNSIADVGKFFLLIGFWTVLLEVVSGILLWKRNSNGIILFKYTLITTLALNIISCIIMAGEGMRIANGDFFSTVGSIFRSLIRSVGFFIIVWQYLKLSRRVKQNFLPIVDTEGVNIEPNGLISTNGFVFISGLLLFLFFTNSLSNLYHILIPGSNFFFPPFSYLFDDFILTLIAALFLPVILYLGNRKIQYILIYPIFNTILMLFSRLWDNPESVRQVPSFFSIMLSLFLNNSGQIFFLLLLIKRKIKSFWEFTIFAFGFQAVMNMLRYVDFHFILQIRGEFPTILDLFGETLTNTLFTLMFLYPCFRYLGKKIAKEDNKEVESVNGEPLKYDSL